MKTYDSRQGDEMKFFVEMGKSIGEWINIIIFITAAIAAVLLVFSKNFAKDIEHYFETSDCKLKDSVYYTLDICYTLFITLISIFPLLGMLGTVQALLKLDMTQERTSLQNNFFSALTSTAWGIIFAIGFKIANSFVQPKIENMIAKAKAALKL